MANNSLNRSFVWVAWILALGVLVFAFQDYLDNQYNPNSNPSSSVYGSRASVVLQQNRYGHYVVTGTINQQQVVFLLDTGATQVSIPEQVASLLNLPYLDQYWVSTANGRVKVSRTHIDELTIGDIVLNDVDAHINPGMQSDEILLGMSALKRVEFRQTGKQLTLSVQ